MDYIAELQMEMSLGFWLSNLISVLIANAIFFVRLRRREHFLIRISLSLIVYLAVVIFLSPILVHYVDPSMSWWLSFLLCVAVGCVCFKPTFINIVFCVICAFALQNTQNIIVEYIVYLAGGEFFNGTTFAVTYVAMGAVVYTLAYFLLAKKLKKDSDLIFRKNYTVVAVAVIFLFSSTGYLNYLPYDTPAHNWLTRLFRIGVNFVVILLMMAYRHNKDLMDDKEVLQVIIAKGNEQFKSMREYMEVIDIKCHDLKKFMNAQNFEEGVNKEIAGELAKSVEEYRNTPKTGIAALDVVLYDKIIVCKKNGIVLTYMIDGDDLNRLKSVDIATIFNNLLYNAIEYVKTLDSEEKRLISLNVQTKFNCLFIVVENYCEDEICFMNGLPVTSKGESHGFGLKSIKYAVGNYGGTFNVKCEDHLFSVDIIIPL